MERGATPLQTSPRVLEHFLALTVPEENEGECMNCIFKMRVNKRFVQREENTRGEGREGLF